MNIDDDNPMVEINGLKTIAIGALDIIKPYYKKNTPEYKEYLESDDKVSVVRDWEAKGTTGRGIIFIRQGCYNSTITKIDEDIFVSLKRDNNHLIMSKLDVIDSIRKKYFIEAIVANTNNTRLEQIIFIDYIYFFEKIFTLYFPRPLREEEYQNLFSDELVQFYLQHIQDKDKTNLERITITFESLIHCLYQQIFFADRMAIIGGYFPVFVGLDRYAEAYRQSEIIAKMAIEKIRSLEYLHGQDTIENTLYPPGLSDIVKSYAHGFGKKRSR